MERVRAFGREYLLLSAILVKGWLQCPSRGVAASVGLYYFEKIRVFKAGVLF